MNTEYYATRFHFTRSEPVSHGGARLVSGRMVAVQSPDKRWEIYSESEGLEVFSRYASAGEASVLDEAVASGEKSPVVFRRVV